MGSVWLAQHLTLRSPVAIKLIDPEIAQNPEALSRFLREAQSAASLRSPHVVQILDHGVDQGVPFIVMELLDGESLASRLEHVRRLSPTDTSRILTQVARAMTKAHEAGIVHRDLKPDNIFLVKNDEDEVAKVLDFGIAKSQQHGLGSVSGSTRTGSVLGTPYYMSPEQAEGAKSLDHRTDVWAMGVIACECLVGARPFDAETLGALLLAICARELPVPSRLGPVPAGFDAWFARACARDVKQRFSSAREAAQELRAVCSGDLMGNYVSPPSSAGGAVQAASLPLASTTAQLSVSSAAREARKKSSGPWLAVAVLAALGVVGAAALVLLRSKPESDISTASSATQVTEPPRSAPPATTAAPEPPPVVATAPSIEPSAVPSASSPARIVNRPRTPPAAEKPKTPPASSPPPATPPAAPPAQTGKPRVNLGI
jgi:eukaryotic-like serine/threonine-protein kinase